MLPYSTPDPDDDQDDMRRPTSDALARQLRDAYFASEEAGRGSPFDSSVPPILIPTDTGGGLGPQVPYRRPHRRKVLLPLLLFLATCASTFFVGALHLGTNIRGVTTIQEKVIANWDSGLQYMAAVMAILLFHEMGHFLQAVRYHIPASFPFFIPFPASPIGTMGAALVLHSQQADRKQVFDIGLTGPLAGLVLAIPIAMAGVITSKAVPLRAVAADAHTMFFQDPLLIKALMWWLRPEVTNDHTLLMNPLLMAGWVGLFVTGLNMMPVGQLDGGHVTYALFGRAAHAIAKTFMFSALVFIVLTQSWNWLVMVFLVMMIGVEHPPTANDNVPIGWMRRLIGLASLTIPIFCFAPFPISLG